MHKIICPQNKIVVQVTKKYYDTITTASGITFYQDTVFRAEEKAMMSATVVASCRSIIRRADYEGYTELPAAGDEILMRYDVVHSYRAQPDRGTPIHKNFLPIDGEEYWLADILQVFAVKTATGYRMLNGHIFCDLLTESRPVPEGLVLPLYMTAETPNNKMRVRYINNGPVQSGDIVYCLPKVAQHYSIDSESFYIIKQSHLLAKDDVAFRVA